jgi:hypothetical protein
MRNDFLLTMSSRHAMVRNMNTAEAIALKHDGCTPCGRYGYHVVVVDTTEDEYPRECLVRWWAEEADTSAPALERSFEVNRDHDTPLVAWGPGDHAPPHELVAQLAEYVAENLNSPLGDPRHG